MAGEDRAAQIFGNTALELGDHFGDVGPRRRGHPDGDRTMPARRWCGGDPHRHGLRISRPADPARSREDVVSLDQVRQLGVELTDAATALAQKWWPGPLTLVFGFAEGNGRPDWLGGRDEVAVRIPGHDFLRRLLDATGVLLVTSANLHGAPTAAAVGAVADALGSQVTLIVDGGTLSDTPSTMVNVRHTEASIERVGTLSESDITDTLAAIR